jgi:5-methylcytosine-specific restriction endonuclease McrA
MSTNKRIRGDTLQRIRKRWFTLHPLCVTCKEEGRVRLATELDHIVPIHKGGPDDDTNRQGLCFDCHMRKTRIDMHWGPAGGCDSEGLPTDPDHHWNRTA